jgi:hypothetical protein
MRSARDKARSTPATNGPLAPTKRTYQGAARLHPREVGFLLAATLLHIAIPVTARLTRGPGRASMAIARSSSASREVVEIDLHPVEPLAGEAREEREEEHAAPEGAQQREETARRLRSEPGRRSESGTPVPAGPPGEPQEVAPAPTAPPSSPDEYGGAPDAEGAGGVVGLNGVPIWQLPGVLPERARAPRASTAPPSPRETPVDKAGEVLREAMRTKDQEMGLDLPAAGTVASVVANAVRDANTPGTARATFEVRLSGTGQVVEVRAVSSTAGAADLWAQIARAAAGRLTGRALAMTAAFAKGAKVYVTVLSSINMPSGTSPGGRIQQSGMGFGFDVSDLAAHATRVVSSSFRVVAVD